MTVATTFAMGTFCCPGLCSADASISKKFYSSLFGWQAVDQEMEGGAYTAFKTRGESVGGMYQMKEERRKAGVSPHWNTYIVVDNADETAKKAAALGGKVISGPFDAEGDRMANVQDPTGAKFSVWEVRKHPEPVRLNEPGALCWTELYTTDTGKAAAFYSSLLGWKSMPFEGSPTPYTVFHNEENPMGIGGTLEITKEMQGMQPQWIPYFQVEDADQIARRAKELGATVHGPMDIPTVGRMAMIADPEGAQFAVIKLLPMK